MAQLLRVSLMLLCLVFLAQAHNKYSKEANENIFAKEKPFRMQKLNLIWDKARKRLDAASLRTLYEDMKHQDKDEIALKKLKADNQDRDGLREAQVRKQLKAIMRKYKIDWDEGLKDGKEADPADSAGQQEKPLFKDKKLDKLWKKAQKGDFNEAQLKILKEELKHYEDKMAQYHHMISELSDKQAKERARRENLENHIDAVLEHEEIKKDIQVDETNRRLKEKHLELKDEFRRLEGMVYNASVNGQKMKGEFEEERASKLWAIALKSDFTDEELAVLREELLHLQTRIQKLNFFQAQLESDKLAGKKGLNDLDEIQLDHHDKHIVGKVKELNHKVEKLHSEIENKILQRHTEL